MSTYIATPDQEYGYNTIKMGSIRLSILIYVHNSNSKADCKKDKITLAVEYFEKWPSWGFTSRGFMDLKILYI